MVGDRQQVTVAEGQGPELVTDGQQATGKQQLVVEDTKLVTMTDWQHGMTN